PCGLRCLSLTCSLTTLVCFFFFQAEDGIRDFHVTGVQTCALPIYWTSPITESDPSGSKYVAAYARENVVPTTSASIAISRDLIGTFILFAGYASCDFRIQGKV